MERTLNFRQPNALEDWRENDEPTSDLYRLTGPAKNRKLRNPEEYRGSADLRWAGPTPQNYEAERRRRRLVKDRIAEMLNGYQWDWFSTYTVNMQAKPDTVHTMFRNHLAFIERKAGVPVYAFRGDEYGVLNGRFHLHALLGNVGGFPAYCGERLPARNPGDKPRPCCGVHSWLGGYARVFPYDPAISATGYVSKYVTKDFGDWELIGDFVPVAERQLTLVR
jgi:hypothetical protein